MLKAPNLSRYGWLAHGFGQRDSVYPEAVTTLSQIHSGLVLEAVPPGGDRFREGDGLVTNVPGMLVGVRTADCVPVLIADERTGGVASVHAGWRGTAENIVAAAVRELITRFGSRAADLHAAIGPSIGPCCYEVGSEVARRFDTGGPERNTPDASRRIDPQKIDLPGINERQLLATGVTDVWVARECTFCDSAKYYSYRREKEHAGRMLSFVGQR
jgi:purine-nucleoside/S-methyl-5'-thioadenosine phosphorylase / adenosine deaminase